jgi:predicted peptidase
MFQHISIGRLSILLVVVFVFVGTSRAGTEGSHTPSPDLVAPSNGSTAAPKNRPRVEHAGDFQVRESNGSAGKRKYGLFIPRDYDPARKYPAIVFLHGAGEQGDDGVKCRTVGIGPAIDKRKDNFPFIVIFPHDGEWNSGDSEKIVLDAIDDAKKNFAVDEDRIALTGLSTGGKGTWVIGAHHPEIFSCLIPVAAQKAEDQAPALAKFPIWAFHSDGDGWVNPQETRDMITKLEAAGAHPKTTYYHSGDHNCWDRAYGESELYAWILAQHRGTSAKR